MLIYLVFLFSLAIQVQQKPPNIALNNVIDYSLEKSADDITANLNEKNIVVLFNNCRSYKANKIKCDPNSELDRCFGCYTEKVSFFGIKHLKLDLRSHSCPSDDQIQDSIKQHLTWFLLPTKYGKYRLCIIRKKTSTTPASVKSANENNYADQLDGISRSSADRHSNAKSIKSVTDLTALSSTNSYNENGEKKENFKKYAIYGSILGGILLFGILVSYFKKS